MSNIVFWRATLIVILVPFAHSSSCGSLSDAELVEKRIESVKVNFFAQLGITAEEESAVPENATVSPPTNATLEEYTALVNASVTIEKNREKKCTSDDFYAKPVSFFAGSMHLEGKHSI